jgi:hypothetical protein
MGSASAAVRIPLGHLVNALERSVPDGEGDSAWAADAVRARGKRVHDDHRESWCALLDVSTSVFAGSPDLVFG